MFAAISAAPRNVSDNATARIVVQATPAEKKTIADKAKALGIPIGELMRRGARSYEDRTDSEFDALANAANNAMKRIGKNIDAAIAFCDASNQRIAAMEAAHARRLDGKAGK